MGFAHLTFRNTLWDCVKVSILQRKLWAPPDWGALLMTYRSGTWANAKILSLFTLRYYWHNPIKKYRKLDSIFKSRIKSRGCKILSLHCSISNFDSQLGKWDMGGKCFCSISLNITFENFLKLIKVLSTRWFVTLNTAQDFLNSSLLSSF